MSDCLYTHLKLIPRDLPVARAFASPNRAAAVAIAANCPAVKLIESRDDLLFPDNP